MNSKLIVALDFSDESKAMDLIHQIDSNSCVLKVGSEMFTKFGVGFVRNLVESGYKIFLDLKFHDIPNTVSRACSAAADLGVWMINVHASGGFKMMEAAKNALMPFGQQRPLLIAVTVLTSMDESSLPEIGIQSTVNEQVSRLAKLSQEAGMDGVVCSAHEALSLKLLCGKEFLAVTPGIRLPGDALDDQSRVVTPLEAIQLGSDYLVIGRPITKSNHPNQVISSILETLSC